MKKTLLLFFALLSLSAFSQKIETVYYNQEGNNIVINYDLKGKGLYTIKCYYTLDGGKSFIPLKTVSGDINKEVVSGMNKKIVWNVFNDSDGIKGEIQFKIEAYKVNLKKSKQGYLTFYTGISGADDLQYYSVQFGRFGWNKLGLGLNISLYNALILFNSGSYVLEQNHMSIGISPVITYKFITKDSYNLIGSFQIGDLGIHNNDLRFRPVTSEGRKEIFSLKSPTISIINNFKHFHVITGVRFLELETDYFIETAQENGIHLSSELPTYSKILFLGIGYTF